MLKQIIPFVQAPYGRNQENVDYIKEGLRFASRFTDTVSVCPLTWAWKEYFDQILDCGVNIIPAWGANYLLLNDIYNENAWKELSKVANEMAVQCQSDTVCIYFETALKNQWSTIDSVRFTSLYELFGPNIKIIPYAIDIHPHLSRSYGLVNQITRSSQKTLFWHGHLEKGWKTDPYSLESRNALIKAVEHQNNGNSIIDVLPVRRGNPDLYRPIQFIRQLYRNWTYGDSVGTWSGYAQFTPMMKELSEIIVYDESATIPPI